MSKKKVKPVKKDSSQSFEEAVYLILKLIMLAVVTVFVTGNVLMSQSMPADFDSFVQSENNAFANVVNKTQKEPSFSLLYNDIKGELKKNSTILFADYEERQKSITSLQEHLKIQNDSPVVLLGLSILYSKQGKNSEAVEYYEKAVALDPTIGRKYGWTRGDLNP